MSDVLMETAVATNDVEAYLASQRAAARMALAELGSGDDSVYESAELDDRERRRVDDAAEGLTLGQQAFAAWAREFYPNAYDLSPEALAELMAQFDADFGL